MISEKWWCQGLNAIMQFGLIGGNNDELLLDFDIDEVGGRKDVDGVSYCMSTSTQLNLVTAHLSSQKLLYLMTLH